jgi:hypothetical protein
MTVSTPKIVASIQVRGGKQLGWFRFVVAPRIGETIEIMDPVAAVDVYRVLEVMHAPQPYVHGKEPLTEESLHLTVEWLTLDTDNMDREEEKKSNSIPHENPERQREIDAEEGLVPQKLAEIEEALKRGSDRGPTCDG